MKVWFKLARLFRMRYCLKKLRMDGETGDNDGDDGQCVITIAQLVPSVQVSYKLLILKIKH